MGTVAKVLSLAASLAEPLIKLVDYLDGPGDDPEAEHQLALDIIRAAKDAKARALGLR